MPVQHDLIFIEPDKKTILALNCEFHIFDHYPGTNRHVRLANLPTAADCAISAAIECSTNSSDYVGLKSPEIRLNRLTKYSLTEASPKPKQMN